MLYQSTYDNLLKLVHSVGVINANQIKDFFADAPDAKKVEYYIRKLIVNREIVVSDTNDNDLMCKSAPVPVKDEIARRIRSLWVPVSMRSANIREIVTLPFPMSYLFITTDNEFYDVAAITSRADALLVDSFWKYYSVNDENEEDPVYHIALLNKEEDAVYLKGLPFDAYCTIDAKGKVTYKSVDD